MGRQVCGSQYSCRNVKIKNVYVLLFKQYKLLWLMKLTFFYQKILYQQYIQRAVTCFNFLTFELLLTVYMVSYTDWLRTVVIVFVIVNYTPPSIFMISSSRKWDSTVTFYRLLSQLSLQVIISLLRCSCRLTLSFETARHITKYNHK